MTLTQFLLRPNLLNWPGSSPTYEAAELSSRPEEKAVMVGGGRADLDDPAITERLDGINAARDQAKVDDDHAQALLRGSGRQIITPEVLKSFAQFPRRYPVFAATSPELYPGMTAIE